jgi:hypothetical protein
MGEDLQDHAGEVWNRACVALATGCPSEARAGDVMLLRAIDFDGEVDNGGLLNRVEEDEGLPDAADEVERDDGGLVQVEGSPGDVSVEWKSIAET